MVYKFFCVDLDGTLLTRRSKISIKNKYACNNLMKLGTSIVIVTGRNEAATVHFSNSLNLYQPKYSNYWVAYNGAMIYDCKNNQYLYERPFQKVNNLKKFIQGLYQNNFLFIIGAKNKSFSNIKCWYLKKKIFKIFFHKPTNFKLDKFTTDVKCYKISIFTRNFLFGFSKSKQAKIQKLVDELGLNYTLVFQKWIVEVTEEDVNKKTAVDFLCKQNNVLPLTQVASVGDSQNDYDLLISSGFKTCPKNADKSIKKIVDVISQKKASQSAVADIINNYILNR